MRRRISLSISPLRRRKGVVVQERHRGGLARFRHRRKDDALLPDVLLLRFESAHQRGHVVHLGVHWPSMRP